MNLYLLLLTHLCVHVLGLMGKPVLALIFSTAALLVYWVHLVLVPAAWPVRILQDTLVRIKAMKTRLHDEAAERCTVEMYALSTDGLHSLVEVEHEVHDALATHRAYSNTPISYARVVFSLCKRARRCRRDVEELCETLVAKIEGFDGIGNLGHHSRMDGVDDEEAATTESCGRGWLDSGLTALIDQGR
ncbi:hypothetical protein FB451DRAFT_1216374 [Mycena latifolia]|nr:hypothetical protein FB451DRAFT_1216374 [Mycena latifolia]